MLVSLSIWFFLNTQMYGDRFTLLIQAGLLFSLLGDIAFLFMDVDAFSFLIGMAMFLLGTLCYLIGFVLNIAAAKAPWQGLVVPTILSIALFACWFWFSSLLMPRVDHDIAAAIWIYLFLIACTAVAASFRWQRTFRRSWLLVLLGTLLFAGSNTLLTLDRFVQPMEHAPVFIWGTYAVAQSLIALGCVWHVRSPTHVRKQEILKT